MERDCYMPKPKYCSFCNNEINVHNLGIEGISASICFDCLELYHQLIAYENKKQKKSNLKKTFQMENITPKSIYQILDQDVIGQKEAKKQLSVALYSHYLRLLHPELELEKSNVLMIGPTGVGKTLLAKTMAKILHVPIAICDATVYTQAGYVGEDVENILLRLIQAADFDIGLAERGIVFIDEFDKLARKSENPSITRDVSGEGVQNALLKIIEGNIVNVPPEGGRKHPYQECIQINTENILFICAGAFDGLDEEKKYSVGFDSKPLNQMDLDVDKIRKYGIIPELLGRLPVHVRLKELTESELKDILTKPSNAITKQYQHIFATANIELAFMDDALDFISKKALEQHSGARSLRKIIEDMMLNTMFELPFDGTIRQIEVRGKEIVKK